MLFWKATAKKIEKTFLGEVGLYAENIRTKKEKIGECSFQFEKRMTDLKKEVELLLHKTKKKEQKAKLQWLMLSIEEYIMLSKYAKKTSMGNQKSRKKIEKHQQKAFEYYQYFSNK